MEQLVIQIMNWMMQNYKDRSRLTKGMIAFFLHTWPGQITCEEFNAFLADFVSGDLPPKTMDLVRFHLKICPMCRRHRHDYEETIKLSKVTGRDNEMVAAPQDLINTILVAKAKAED